MINTVRIWQDQQDKYDYDWQTNPEQMINININ